MTRRVGWALAAIAALVCAVLAVPFGAGLVGIAQVVSFRAVIAIASLLAAVLVALVSLLLPRDRRRALAPLATVLTLAAVAQATVVAVRSHAPTIAASSANSVTVLSFNTLGTVDASTLAQLIEAQHPQVAVLPETSVQTATATAELLADAGIAMQLHTSASVDPWVDGIALLVSPDLGTYATAESLPLRHGGLRTATTGGPTIVAVHPVSPTSLSSMSTWRAETRQAADECTDTAGAIVAGDFNATLDHPGLAHLAPCIDVADAVGEGATGTWPASAPTWLATPIDHVLVDGRAWRAISFRVLPATGGSDHRPVVATVAPR